MSDRASKDNSQRPGRSNEDWLRALRGAQRLTREPGGGPEDQAETHAALAELSRFLRGGLVRSLGTRRIDDATLDDFTQDAIVRVVEKLDTFRGESKFTTWAMAIAIRTALNELRRARWKDVGLEDALAGAEPPSRETTTVEDEVDRASILAVMERVIERELTDKQRRVLRAELDGIPQVVIAEQLGTNRNALYKLVHDARQRLKRGLADAGISDEEVRAAFGS